jgi:hypothetical protein
MVDFFPKTPGVDDSLPAPAREYLRQAISSIHAPAGAVMLSASAVDAMLKAKGLTTGSLYSRIEQAAKDHLITEEMSAWAHDVRLDANDQRHADPDTALPSSVDAQRCVDFATAFGQFLFVIPSRVARGRKDASQATLPNER